MDDAADDRYIRITLRIPRELHAELTREADRTSKSLNAEIISRLSQASSDGVVGGQSERLILELQRTQLVFELGRMHSEYSHLWEAGHPAAKLVSSHSSANPDPAPVSTARKKVAAITKQKHRLDADIDVAHKKLAEVDAKLKLLTAAQQGSAGDT